MMCRDYGFVSFRRWKVFLTILCLSARLLFQAPCTDCFALVRTPPSRIHPFLPFDASNQRMAILRRSLHQQQSADLELEVLNPNNDNANPTAATALAIPKIATDKAALTSPFMDNESDDRKDVWTVLGLLWLIAAISALDRVAMSVALIPMASEFHFTDTTSGAISSLFSVGYGLAILPAGLLVSCISPKQVLACGVVVWSLATWATPACAALLPIEAWPILLIRALVGMGEAMVIPTIHRLLSVWTSARQKSSGRCGDFSMALRGRTSPPLTLLVSCSHCLHLQWVSCRYHWCLPALSFGT
jgi:Major Facilitator Superfamily